MGISCTGLFAFIFYVSLNLGQGAQNSFVLESDFMPESVEQSRSDVHVAHHSEIKGSVSGPSNEDLLLSGLGEQRDAGEDGFLQIVEGRLVGGFSVFGSLNQISYYFDLRPNPVDGSSAVQSGSNPKPQGSGGKPADKSQNVTDGNNPFLVWLRTPEGWWMDHSVWSGWYVAVSLALILGWMELTDEIRWRWRWNWGPWWKKRFSSANVRDDGSPLAFGADPAAAGCVTKVPKAW